MAQGRKPVGVIGTGLMGMACAKRLLAAGHDVLGYDIDAAKLAALAETYRALMEGCVAAGEYKLDNAAVIREIRRRSDRTV
jgi:3-hydroxyacyl-CoA dehydrogenase